MKVPAYSDKMYTLHHAVGLSPGDIEDIRELYIEAGWLAPGDDSTFLAPAIAGASVALVAREDGRIIAFGRALSDGCSDAYIQDVVVSSRCRKRGIGGAVVMSLAEELRKKGCDWIGLVGEPGTEKFYADLGFQAQKGYTLWKIPKK